MYRGALQPKLDAGFDDRYAPLEDFIAEAVARAGAAGYFPAQFQRPVDWEAARAWAAASGAAGFAWRGADDRTTDAIIVGPGPDGTRAIHSGQHRILGGLMSGNPVPDAAVTWLSVPDPTRGWLDPVPEVDIFSLL